jgi:hypothetical protein
MSDIQRVTIRQEVEFVHDIDFSEFTKEERKAVAKLLQKIPWYPDDE